MSGEKPTECSHMEGCEMYDLFALSGTLAVWKIRYCTSDFERCERFQRTKDGKPVPANLMPNGVYLKKTS